MKTSIYALAIAAAFAFCGCFTVKTESEIKPIHITMDVNLKVDKELDRVFADENARKPNGDFKVAKDLVDRKAAGFTELAMLEAREGASEDDRISIAEENQRRLRRFQDVASSSGASLEAVQRRRARQIREKLSPGAWYKDDSGTWRQK